MLVQMSSDQRDCGQQVPQAGCESSSSLVSASKLREQVQLLSSEMKNNASERQTPSELSSDQNLNQKWPLDSTSLKQDRELGPNAIKRNKVSSTTTTTTTATTRIDVRLLVRRREAGALIGKQGANIKRMREQYNGSTFNIPDTGNGPERIVCINSESWQIMETILLEISQLFLDKSSALNLASEDQVELKQLINSAYAGLLIGIGGQSIRKLRNDSKAAIKIYEMCCPQSDERVCAIKARPPVVVGAIKMIHQIMLSSQSSIKCPLQAHKLYDALNFDLNQVDKYGGHALDDCGPQPALADLNTLSSSQKPLHLYHQHRHSSQPQTTGLQQHVVHFNPMARADAEPLPFVMSPPTMLRPGLFFSPVQQIDFAPFHSLVNRGQFMSLNTLNKRPKFNPRPNFQANFDQYYGTPTTIQFNRNQRFHPYESTNHLSRMHLRNRNHQPTTLQSFNRPGQQQATRYHRPFNNGQQQPVEGGDLIEQQSASESSTRQSIGCSCSVVKANCIETAQANSGELAGTHLNGSSEVVNRATAMIEPLSKHGDSQQLDEAPESRDATGNSSS